MERMDAEVRQDLLDALEWDVRLNSADVDIDVAHGHVILRGMVPTLQEKMLARRIAARIKGVRDVNNEIRVAPGLTRTDEEISADVREALRRDVWVNEDRISVVSNRSVVHLSGTVDTFAEKDAAEDDAWRTPGVVEVSNNILVAPPVTRDDADIAADVCSDLTRNIRIDPSRVDVEVNGGIVSLRGGVSTYAQKWIADDVAWWTPGVRDVINELEVED